MWPRNWYFLRIPAGSDSGGQITMFCKCIGGEEFFVNRMGKTRTKDRTFTNEKYQSHRVAQRQSTKIRGRIVYESEVTVPEPLCGDNAGSGLASMKLDQPRQCQMAGASVLRWPQ
jgi:hypothetical protein